MTNHSSSDDPTNWWDRQYAESENLPWDTGRPQTAIVECSRTGEIEGRVLDVGCGVGTESLYLAEQGHAVVGIDFSEVAIDRARTRAMDRSVGSRVRFETADAFSLTEMDIRGFDTIIDCGMLHTVDPADRREYTAALAAVLSSGGRAVFVEFGEDAPDEWGPIPLSATELRQSFDDRWCVDIVESCAFETRQGAVPGIRGVARTTQ